MSRLSDAAAVWREALAAAVAERVRLYGCFEPDQPNDALTDAYDRASLAEDLLGDVATAMGAYLAAYPEPEPKDAESGDPS